MGSDRLLSTFLDLVRIDSPPGSESEVARYCSHVLAELGFEVRFDDTREKTGSDSGNLIALRPGEGIDLTLVLSAHMDCVEPCRGVEPRVDGDVVSSAGETVLGADDKAGIAAILEACRRITEEAAPRPAIRVVLSVSEEVGLKGAKAIQAEDVVGDLCLVLDADGDPGGIVVAAPTQYTFTAVFAGTAAHAGVAPEKGRSALVMAARAIGAMRLGRLDADSTANIGSVNGGTATNVVPASTEMTGECRSLDRERVEEIRESMDKAMREAALAEGGDVSIEWRLEYEGYSFAEDDPILGRVEEACRDVGLTPRPVRTGGGSDANVISSLGVPTLALSSGMRSVHSTDEHVLVSEMESLTRLVVEVARRMGES